MTFTVSAFLQRVADAYGDAVRDRCAAEIGGKLKESDAVLYSILDRVRRQPIQAGIDSNIVCGDRATDS